MKKLIYAELAILLLLLIAAAVAAAGLSLPAFAPDKPNEPVQTDGQSGENVDNTAGQTEPSATEFVPDWKTYPQTRQLLAQQYFVYDCKQEEFLTVSGSTDERIWPASVTKLFTAYVALQYLQPETEVTAGKELDLVAWGSSVAKLQKGDVLSVKQLVEAMMLPSGNDAAYVLAAAAGRAIENSLMPEGQSVAVELDALAAVSEFMQKMNEQALAEGMTGTNFVNPDGIHDEYHYMSVTDLVILGKLAMENETIMQYAATARENLVLHGEEVEWKNTNALIDPATPYYCPYALGLKTGQTPSAGSCLLSAFRYGEHELIIGVFGCPEEEDRFDDTLQLFNSVVLDS